jgi:class 3 adenylate cyclase
MRSVTCPECGEQNASDARFCRTCGSVIQRPSSTGARRFVTVLRSDVQGSTRIEERHDPELVRRVLTRYYDAARTVCSRHGGVIEQIQGDAVVALFEGHENDALQAVRAAVELRERMARTNEELERDPGIRLPIRTAVASGRWSPARVAPASSPAR